MQLGRAILENRCQRSTLLFSLYWHGTKILQSQQTFLIISLKVFIVQASNFQSMLLTSCALGIELKMLRCTSKNG